MFVAIPSGPPKSYALAYMFAALQNLDYTNIEFHFALSRYHGGWKDEAGFHDAVIKLVEAVPLKGSVTLHDDRLRQSDMIPYGPVIRNLALLRGLFLDGDADYFLLLGGDNPPHRNTLRRLLALNADVACGVAYQRPERGLFGVTYPLLYEYSWTLDELPPDLPEHLWLEFRKSWQASMFYLPIYLDPDWQERGILTKFAAGTGCTLIKRCVLENLGFYLPESKYHSEDINFFTHAYANGFTLACDPTFHIAHFDADGVVY